MNELGTDNLMQAVERYTSMLPQGMDYVKGVAEGGAQSPKGLAALMALNSLAKAPADAPAGTIREKITGIPSVTPPQNNQDPRLMAGMGGMDARGMPAVDAAGEGGIMNAASGGFVGYQDGGIVGFQNRGFVGSGRNRQRMPDFLNTSDIPPEDMEPETYMTMRDMEEFERMYGYRPTRSDASNITERGSLQQIMESERPLTRGVGKLADFTRRGFGLFDNLSMPQSPRQLAEPAEIAKELKRRAEETSIPIEDEATVAATKKRNPSFQSIRDVIAGTQGGREGYLEKRTREGLILDKREKEARAAAEKAAAEKAAEEKAAAAKIAAEKRAKELEIEKAARKKRQRESGRELTASAAAMLKAAEEGKSTFGVIGEGLTGREDAVARREAAEVAAKEAASVQETRKEDLAVKRLAADATLQAALAKSSQAERTAIIDAISDGEVALALENRVDQLLESDPTTYPTRGEAYSAALNELLRSLNKANLISGSIGAAQPTQQTSLNPTTAQYIQ